MTYTATTQGAQASPASVFVGSLDTLLVAAGFTFMEQWPQSATHVRVAAASGNVASLSGFATVIDSVTLVDGDKVLLTAQTTASQNGIWVAHSGAWTRDTDYDADGDLFVELHVYVDAGTGYANSLFKVTATGATPWVVGTSTSTWSNAGAAWTDRIYKSPAGSNSQGADWFLVVHRATDAATSILFSVAEQWNTTTKKLQNYAPSAQSAPVAVTFNALSSLGVVPNSSALSQRAITLSAAGFQYWVSANPNRITITTRIGTTNYSVYIGLYDDILPVSISPFPLCVLDLTFANTVGLGLGRSTREPNTTTSITGNFGLYVSNSVGFTADAVPIYFTSLIPGRVVVYSSRVVASAASGASANGARGFLKDVIYQTIVGAVAGDTIVVTDAIGGIKTYTAVGTAISGVYWVDQAA